MRRTTFPLAVRLRGGLQVAALEAAIEALVERHESLRTVFPESLGTPRQEVLGVEASHLPLKVQAVSAEELEGSAKRNGCNRASISHARYRCECVSSVLKLKSTCCF